MQLPTQSFPQEAQVINRRGKKHIPWLGGKCCNLCAIFDVYPDRLAITRLGTESEDDVFFISILCQVHAIFICFVPKMGPRRVIMSILLAMHREQNRTTPDHGIDSHERPLPEDFSIRQAPPQGWLGVLSVRRGSSRRAWPNRKGYNTGRMEEARSKWRDVEGKARQVCSALTEPCPWSLNVPYSGIP